MKSAATVLRRCALVRFAVPVLLLCLSFPGSLSAAAPNPETVVRDLFAELLSDLDAQRAADTLTPESAREVFARLLNPRIDYDALARWLLRDYWTNSSEDQHERFLAAFRDYIINTYSVALSSGKEIALDVHDNPLIRKNTAIVDAEFTVENADPVPLQFRMIERDERWYLFDVSFSGVSLALTFRSDFNYVADEGGIDAVTAHLVQRAGGS